MKKSNTYNCPVKSIKIGPFDYELRWLDGADVIATLRHGQSEHDFSILYIVSSINKWRMIDTLYHEINHALEYVFGLKLDNESDSEDKSKSKSEEQHVNCLASGWVMVNRDNPKFREWVNSLYRD